MPVPKSGAVVKISLGRSYGCALIVLVCGVAGR
jgi:hypothetical protein